MEFKEIQTSELDFDNHPNAVRVKIHVSDSNGRFHSGEDGLLLKNDFDKYDHKVYLRPKDGYQRVYYFYDDEIEFV